MKTFTQEELNIISLALKTIDLTGVFTKIIVDKFNAFLTEQTVILKE